MNKFKLAVCQMNVKEDKAANIKKALDYISTAASNKADMIVLPEMFNCPYDSRKFSFYAEEADSGETIRAISDAAANLGIYITAGSIPEIDHGKLYNSCFVFDRKGSLIGKHRKMHLFDIDIPGQITFKESETLSPGEAITIVDTEFCKVGIAICYDMRFPELIRLMALKGAKLIVIPAAFNMTTGPAHWEALIRIRAVDNQVYMAAASPARDMQAGYVAYGNSMIVEPWGNIIARAAEKEDIIYADIDGDHINKIRNELPLLKHRRIDIYDIREK